MRSPSVLIADDEHNIRLLLQTCLETDGYSVRQARDGVEALESIRRDVPDLVLLDLSMPELDGIRVLKALHDGPADCMPRVIVLTAHGSITRAVQATRLGARDFLEKPVSVEEVREAVQAVLAEPPAASESDPLAGGYQGVLERARRALQDGQLGVAETLLMKAADLGRRDAAYFNLLGVLHEARRDWKSASKFYGKAIAADKRYGPAQSNMRRLYELYTFGRSHDPVSLGSP